MSTDSAYDPRLQAIVRRVLERLEARSRELLPRASTPLWEWLGSLATGGRPEAYFTHPLSFPMLLLPWWLEEALAGEVDLALQEALAASTVAGYSGIRLIDDAMDEGGPAATGLLPAAAFFFAEFERPYRGLFPPQHPFWELLARRWAAAADAAIADAAPGEIDLARFRSSAARKVGAGIIPLAAVALRHGLPAVPSPWEVLFDRLGAWHQLYNDLFDWQRDLAAGRASYVLSEARRCGCGDSVAAWLARSGFAWGSELLRAWLGELRALASALPASGLGRYLAARDEALAATVAGVSGGLGEVVRALEAAR